jgi:hypothetical protein
MPLGKVLLRDGKSSQACCEGPGKQGWTEMKLGISASGFADGMNLLGDNTQARNRNAETVTDASKEVGLEERAEKIKSMLLSLHQNADQKRT